MTVVRHYLRGDDLSPQEQELVLDSAFKLSRNPSQAARFLIAEAIGLFFQKPSLRTRVSAEVACSKLGAHPIQLRGDELHFKRGETPEDAARVLGGYLSLLMARVDDHKFLEAMAASGCLPIVNGLSDRYHPLQALADLLTLKEVWNGDLRGKNLHYFGDGNNVCASLLVSGALAGLNVVAACPQGFEPSEEAVNLAQGLAKSTGGSITITHEATAQGADALYTDVWTSMGYEGEESSRRESMKPYQLNAGLLSQASSDAVVLHCLPAHIGEEITLEVAEGPQSRIIKQAHNRLPAAMALFLFLLDPDKCRALL